MIVLVWIFFAVVSAMALGRFNKAGMGFLLGIILGPLGLIAALIWRSNLMADQRAADTRAAAALARGDDADHRDCPHCAERILRKAKVCMHCARDVEPMPLDTGPVGHCSKCLKSPIPMDSQRCPACKAVFTVMSGNYVVPNKVPKR